MLKKLKILMMVGSVALLILIGWFLFLKDDYKQIENEVYSLDQMETQIVHIEIIDDYALAIYRWDGLGSGVIEFEKTLFGWKMTSGISEWSYGELQFVKLENFSVIQQSVVRDAENIHVELQNGESYPVPIIKGENTSPRWYYYSATEDLAGATVTTYDKDGQVVEEIQVPDEPSGGAVTQVEEQS
ncbi:hypothetical protein HXZ66_01915 [Bacillus sp. A116_S68]|nr:hypothetical protein HXZ66_01915 [Bacillus sp. A116_S68]